jgi:DNA-binding MarR family transcriptional regulator/N-acetylglutamate synthase-like GNAT family acetyltransferase
MANVPPERVEAVRHFNRFYTRQIGLLDEGLLDSPFSLTEARVLYELAHREAPAATEVRQDLGLNAGYLSRILRGFRKRGLVARRVSAADGRRSLLRLTPRGRAAFAGLDTRSQADVAAALGRLPAEDQRRLAGAMRTIEELLGPKTDPAAAFVIRPPEPGDYGWVVARHGALYASEYGWDETFEGLVAEIVARYLEKHDPKREAAWIAERDGQNVGSVFLVRKSRTAAKLRLLLIEPRARGFGLGNRLVGECLRFARKAGYRKVTLWTNDILHAARHIYEKFGFRLTGKERHHSFGHDLVAETWELDL